VYYVLKYIAWFVIFLTMRYHRQGIENIPQGGAFLIVANHLSVSDPVIIGLSLHRRVTFLAKEELFKNPLSRYFVSSFGALPVYRGKSSRDTLHKAFAVLENGSVLAMFPEGRRSPTGQMISPQPGSALIAYHNKAKIVPVGVYGTEVIRGFKWIFKRPSVYIKIGEPFYLPYSSKALNREQLAGHSVLIMQHIAALIPQNYRGSFSGEEKH
jgi:1-acyl-sn-glycerol-3-phosphate acyltransferase